MNLMHHNGLRVNVAAVDSPEAMAIYHEAGWRLGPHKDSDPDDPSDIPRVLPATDPEPTAEAPRRGRNQKE